MDLADLADVADVVEVTGGVCQEELDELEPSTGGLSQLGAFLAMGHAMLNDSAQAG